MKNTLTFYYNLMIRNGLHDVQYGFKKLNWKIITLSQVWWQALTCTAKSTRMCQLWNLQPSTEDTTSTTKTKDRRTGYSYDVMIVTWNLWITKVFWPPSQWSKTHKNYTIFLVLAYYLCWYFDYWKIGNDWKCYRFKDYEEKSRKYNGQYKNYWSTIIHQIIQ